MDELHFGVRVIASGPLDAASLTDRRISDDIAVKDFVDVQLLDDRRRVEAKRSGEQNINNVFVETKVLARLTRTTLGRRRRRC